MPKLATPTWFYVLEAAKEFNGKQFTQNDIVDKIKANAPRVKKNTIICNLYGITPHHPSCKTFPSLLKNHAAFSFLGKGKFKMLEKEEQFKLIIMEVNKILRVNLNNVDKLKAICKLLKNRVSYYNWVCFYSVDKVRVDELMLISFDGEPTEHVRIPFGKGICGQAAFLKRTFIVQDVSKEANYLSCGSKVKSEIVIPIFRNELFVGELDIDSHFASPFNSYDEKCLAVIAKIASELL